jgi:hypothetical protein
VVAVASSSGVRIYGSGTGDLIDEVDYQSRGSSYGFASHDDDEGWFRVPDHVMTFSADGSILASDTYGREDDVLLWDVSSGRRLGSLARSGSGSTDWSGLAFSHDNQVAATGDTDVHFRRGFLGIEVFLTLWDVDTRERIGTIPIEGFTLDELFFGPSDQLFSVNLGTVIEWDTQVQAWIDRACQMVGRNLTQKEWDEFLPSNQDFEETCTTPVA